VNEMPKPSPDGLIALLKDKSDLAILQEQGRCLFVMPTNRACDAIRATV
jgi:hypothetical protein